MATFSMTPRVFSTNGVRMPSCIDEYGYYITHEDTFKKVAQHLLAGQSVFLSWSDQIGNVYDIVFTAFAIDMKANGSYKYSADDLFVNIIDKGSFAIIFDRENNEYNLCWAPQIVEATKNSISLVAAGKISDLIDGITNEMDTSLFNQEINELK